MRESALLVVRVSIATFGRSVEIKKYGGGNLFILRVYHFYHTIVYHATTDLMPIANSKKTNRNYKTRSAYLRMTSSIGLRDLLATTNKQTTCLLAHSDEPVLEIHFAGPKHAVSVLPIELGLHTVRCLDPLAISAHHALT
jgi:hypothetical protein